MVVARAIRTIIANNVGEITPRSRPMFKTISSISPRVFIRMPSEADVREKFLRYAADCVEAASAQRFADAVLNGPPNLGLRRLWGLLEPQGTPR